MFREYPAPVRGLRLHAEKVGERDDAAPAVAAHHPAGAVGIVEFHPEVRGCIRPEDHQAVGAMHPAAVHDPGAVQPARKALPAVQDDKRVAGSAEKILLHRRERMISARRATPGAIFSSAM